MTEEERNRLLKLCDDLEELGIKQIQEIDYLKKRCEAAELNISTYSDWQADRLDVDRLSSTADVLFLKWKAAFDNWQQLKNNKL